MELRPTPANQGCGTRKLNRCSKDRRIQQNQVVPDDGNAEDQGVDTVEYAAMSGEKTAGIFYAGATLVGSFEEVAHLAGDVAKDGHDEEMRESDGNPEAEGVSDEERAEHAADRAFPGFLWRDVRSQRVFADGAANEIGGGVSSPSDAQSEEEEPRADFAYAHTMESNGEGEWESHEEERAGGNAG